MKMFSFIALAAAAFAVVPFQSAEAGRGCGCCGSVAYAAPAAASPAAAANVAPAATVAQNQGYRSFSYQPAVTTNYNGGYYSNRGRSNQPIWANGANKSLGRVNP